MKKRKAVKKTNMSKRTFYRTIIQVEVLSENPYGFNSLADTAHDILHGDCSGKVGVVRHSVLNGRACARALLHQGSDPGFFRLTEKGEDMDGEGDADGGADSGENSGSRRNFTIPAEAHSDDRVIEAKFDALPYFKKASDKQLIDLAACGMSHDYPADEVAQVCADSDPGVRKLFSYIDMVAGTPKKCGYECKVESSPAFRWLATYRPSVTLKILEDEIALLELSLVTEDEVEQYRDMARKSMSMNKKKKK